MVRYQYKGVWYTSWKTFADDLPHGNWTWKDAAGNVLQTARFERGEIVDWNGQAIRGDLKEWFTRHRISAASRAALALPAESIAWFRSDWIGHFGVTEFHLRGQDQRLELAGVYEFQDQHLLNELRKHAEEQPAETVAMCLLKTALQENYTLVARAGVLCVTPITPKELDPRDRTGLSQVTFAPGSTQATDWLSPPPEPLPVELLDSGFLQALFVGTSIQIDASEFPTNRPTEFLVAELYRSNGRLPPFCNFHSPHRRCDLLGLILHQQKWSCEQRGNVFILHPYPAEEE